MKDLTIVGIVVMYLILIAFQHVLNWGFRDRDKNFPIMLVIMSQIASLIAFAVLTYNVAIIF